MRHVAQNPTSNPAPEELARGLSQLATELVYGPYPLREAGAGLDPDSEAALEAGARVDLGTEIEVR